MLIPTWSSPSLLSRITSFGSHAMTHPITTNTPTSTTSSHSKPHHSHLSFFRNEFTLIFPFSFYSLIPPLWTPSFKEPQDPLPQLVPMPSSKLNVFDSSSKYASILLSTMSSLMESPKCKLKHIDRSLQEIHLLHILLKPSCSIASCCTNKDVSTFVETSFSHQKQSLQTEDPKYLVVRVEQKSLHYS
jgi:hypothetical protein